MWYFEKNVWLLAKIYKSYFYLLVTMSFSLDFSKNIHSVVVSQGSTHLVIVHAKMVFLNAPQSSQTSWINNFKHPSLLIFPLDVGCVSLTRVVEKLLEKIPEETAISCWRFSGFSWFSCCWWSWAACWHLVGWPRGSCAWNSWGCCPSRWSLLCVLHWVFAVTIGGSIGVAY